MLYSIQYTVFIENLNNLNQACDEHHGLNHTLYMSSLYNINVALLRLQRLVKQPTAYKTSILYEILSLFHLIQRSPKTVLSFTALSVYEVIK